MSEQPAYEGPPADIPIWDIADRMRKSLRHAGVTPGQMATYLGVGGNTVSTWINGRILPSVQTVRLWALRTGVPFEWLCHGDTAPCSPTGRRIGSGSNFMHCTTLAVVA